MYKPRIPNSLMTPMALTFGPDVISPATCKRIFTMILNIQEYLEIDDYNNNKNDFKPISNGFVNITCDAPALKFFDNHNYFQ